MTANPYLRRLLGEAGIPPAEIPAKDEAPEAEARDEAPEAEARGPEKSFSARDEKAAPRVQELVQQWQRGERMGVAARLMFTEASYADFVDLLFLIGHADGRELGQLLDELADTQGIEPPETPPEYKDALSQIAGDEEEGVL